MINAIHQQYGYDLRDYARASLIRRLSLAMKKERLRDFNEFQDRLLHSPAFFYRLLGVLSVNVSAMFRDPDFYLALRRQVIPLLRTWPFIRIWHAGCANGEEVYSMAILLKEEGLYERSRIYATDFSELILEQAKQGIYSCKNVQTYIENYRLAGGKEDFSCYYRSDYDRVIIRNELKKNIVFAQHNLVSDGSFNEFNLILCRNVMIYFNNALKDRTLRLLHQSLCRFGVLALGKKESLNGTELGFRYDTLAENERLYRRIGW
ncbi:protein-glutamate O-methyltransferase CheR [Litoribacillus peritrichatus]|uniref:CheR family methyltransferase n=1 Tax=Litoribacillus peritrichatus TaxID=718191 RepID=UPI0031DB40D2